MRNTDWLITEKLPFSMEEWYTNKLLIEKIIKIINKGVTPLQLRVNEYIQGTIANHDETRR